MRAGDLGGEGHAPTPSELVRAPLTSADDYTAAASHVLTNAWDYEAQRPVADASPVVGVWCSWESGDSRWTLATGCRQCGAQRALVVRGGTA